MARKLFHLSLVGVVLVAGAASYAVRRNLSSAGQRPMDCARRWLDLSDQQCRNIRSEDPDFRQEAQSLSQTLQGARKALVALVADSQSSDQAMADQAQEVLDAHHALMRRSVRRLMVMRQFADVSQGDRLNTLCSNAMRCGKGRGMGMGMGPGMGMRRGQMHGQRALTSVLTLTGVQQQNISKISPNYETECFDLMRQVRAAHMGLSQALQDTDSSDDLIQEALESFIAARTAFEKHTIDYVISIRSLLTPEQQQRLIGLCRGGC
jgi:Spy/CpxP family protein refolding chaperone